SSFCRCRRPTPLVTPQHPFSTLFPYTRSSDLLGTAPAAPVSERDPVLVAPPAVLHHRMDWITGNRGKSAHTVQPSCVSERGAGRSEEHTSELQSRENLVCRLLLEKKKKNTDTP